jgi:hypothetical protein
MPSFDPLERLTLLVESVRSLPNQIRFERRSHTPGNHPLDKIDYCSQALLTGALPDAETLLFVAEAFYKPTRRPGMVSGI